MNATKVRVVGGGACSFLTWGVDRGYVDAMVVVTNTISVLGQRRCGEESHASHEACSADPPTAWQNFPQFVNNIFHMQKNELKNCSATSGMAGKTPLIRPYLMW